jgi:hypothetical protein
VVVFDLDVQDDDSSHMIADSGSGLYERPSGSDTWQRRRPGKHMSVEFEPDSATTYYAGAHGRLIRTDNNGGSWRQSNDLGGAFPSDIEIDPSLTDTVFITAGQQVLRSTDGGLAFDPVMTGANPDGENYRMNTVVIDPSDSRHLIAGWRQFLYPQSLWGYVGDPRRRGCRQLAAHRIERRGRQRRVDRSARFQCDVCRVRPQL